MISLEQKMAIYEQNRARWIQLETAQVQALLKRIKELEGMLRDAVGWVRSFQSPSAFEWLEEATRLLGEKK